MSIGILSEMTVSRPKRSPKSSAHYPALGSFSSVQKKWESSPPVIFWRKALAR